MSDEDDLEVLMAHIGEFGKYQFRQFLLHLLAAFTAGMHMLTLVTVAAVPDHRCYVPGLDTSVGSGVINGNLTELIVWIPTREDGRFDSCKILDPTNNESSHCDSWVFDNTYYQSSRAIEWNFVCDRRWMSAVSQSSYMFGVFAGAVTLGSLADSYGRKTIFYISALLQLFFGTTIAFVTNYYLFLAMSFFYGIFGSAGSYITAFVLTMELVGPSKRTACGILFQATFAVGVVMVAVWGYMVKDHVTLQMIYGLHSLLLVGHWWLIDESPRWLWFNGRIKESVKIIEKASKINGGPTVDVAHFVSRGNAKSNTAKESAGLADLFRTPFLRKKTLNLALNWFANSLVYYGLSLNTGSLKGDPYFILFVMAVVELPGYFLTILILDKTGRRPLICTFMIVGSVACLCTAVIPPESTTIINSVVFLGKFCISSSFAIIYNYSAELFPTVLRNTGLGFGSMCARFSAALTPLITLLDSFDKRFPTVLFALVALLSGFLTMFLPETMGEPMPQSLQDGETFGRGDTCFSTRSKRKSDPEEEAEIYKKPPKVELKPMNSS
ncbi:Sugar (and other) transporter [Nesidiocoris tenuis]|uniref:Sugar (And other) transporter n=1 Tax=Nesidiocoris tenuis TaxID=355587 RepID=A0ABN7BC29_9HEMI|nr:Sugar (and other) transporter [Nesidiocoris tenuis]